MQMSRSAHERIAAFEKTQRPVRFLGDADAHTDSDFPRRTYGGAEPQLTWAAQVSAIEFGSNAKGFRQTPRPPREIEQALGKAIAFHPCDALEWLDRAEQYALSDARARTRNVEHIVVSVDEIDVRVSALEEERAIAVGETAKRMGCRVADDISFRFDDAPGQACTGKFVHQSLADEKTRELHRFEGQLSAFETTDCVRVHAIALSRAHVSLEKLTAGQSRDCFVVDFPPLAESFCRMNILRESYGSQMP